VPSDHPEPGGNDPVPGPLGTPWPDANLSPDPSGADQGAPEPGPAGGDFSTQRYGAPWPDPAPAAEPGAAGWNPSPPEPSAASDDFTARRFGAPWPDPAPPSAPGPAWSQSPVGPAGNDPSTQRFGAPWPDVSPSPAQDPADWDQALPPSPGQRPGDGSAGKNRRTPLLIGGIVVVVLLGGGLAYALTQGSSGPDSKTGATTGKPGAGTAAQQAAAVNQVLKSGRTARGHLPGRLRTCDDVSAGVSGFQQVVRDRQQELSESKKLTVDQLQNGARLRRSMIAAYQSSLKADQAYLAWAQEIKGRGCGSGIAPLTAHYRAAITANGKAGPAKRQVAGLWRPIASSHGLPAYAWNRL
jgi:hypothetical protein